ncbi:type II secretion system protein GspC [Endozoicomonas ascidiicola]|uniref:type II secretion system protein GspC n=1 Tax=Endozoicomonas ascidiicola TaxID=1698521 RepID=UPI00082C6C31|nr:type II secretion system protein GspC [Endozoicomonas ascidiicola]
MIYNNNKTSSNGHIFTSRKSFFRRINIIYLKYFFLLILILLIARESAQITWLLMSDANSTPAELQQDLQQNKTVTIPDQSDLHQLKSLQLFGQPPIPVKKSVPKDIPVSRIAARITGLVFSSNPEGSLAIIRSGSSDLTYRKGDTLKGTQATVDAIYSDRVIIQNGVRYESLLMYPEEASKKIATNNTVTATHIKKSSKNISDLKTQLQEKPESWSEIVTISPIRRDGKLQGYRINPAKYPQYFSELGLKPNDMAIAINGFDLTDNNEAMKVIGQLSSLQQISLTIERDGQRFEIDLSS